VPGLLVDGRVLLPLRLFVGVTYVYAGLQKLSSGTFLGTGPGSIHQQLRAASITSPIHSMLVHLVPHATLVGLVIALAELAAGIGLLLGLFTRLAAAGAMSLAVGFLLAVSWHTSPYYLGPDIVFSFALIPFVLAGAGTGARLSLDGYLPARTRVEAGVPARAPVAIDFAMVQRVCGGYDRDRCGHRNGRPCDVAACPVLLTDPVPARKREEIDRRAFLRKARLAGTLALGATAVAAITAAAGRLVGGTTDATSGAGTTGLGGPAGTPPTTPPATALGAGAPGNAAPPSTSPPPTTAPPASAAPAGTAIGRASEVPVGGAAGFTDPATGAPAYVLQPSAGVFHAFDASCTHEGCPVQVDAGATEFSCPCHGARFSTATGAVLQGPAHRPLAQISVVEGGDGVLYVDG
jgi:thiosulfate dehydrogenase [quinone] large subunit